MVETREYFNEHAHMAIAAVYNVLHIRFDSHNFKLCEDLNLAGLIPQFGNKNGVAKFVYLVIDTKS